MRTTYKITNETKATADGATLHRIIALPGNRFASPGSLGGWIEKEENLSDGAWAADNACVYGNAAVYGNTLIEDDSMVYGNATIHGETDEVLTLSFDTKVHGGDWIEEPYRRCGGLWTINISSPNTVRIGCRDYTFEKWHKSFKAIIRIYRGEAIAENGVNKCVEVYNDICCRYGRAKYMVNPDEVLDYYRKVRVSIFYDIGQALTNS